MDKRTIKYDMNTKCLALSAQPAKWVQENATPAAVTTIFTHALLRPVPISLCKHFSTAQFGPQTSLVRSAPFVGRPAVHRQVTAPAN